MSIARDMRYLPLAVTLEVQTFAELRGHNDFEEALIARSLPTVEDRGAAKR